MPENTTQAVKLALSRTGGVAQVEFTVPEVVRSVWAAKGLEVKNSTAWSGLSFYVLKDEDRTDAYKSLLANYGLRDDFGSAILDERGRFNVAFLRCTTESGAITVNDAQLSFSTLADNMRNFARFVREFVEQNVSDYRITGSVSIEV